MPTLHIEPDQRSLEVASEDTLLRGALQQGVPIAHACGGQARCTTCRVHVLEGAEHLSVRTEAEAALARRVSLPPGMRLACQTRLHGSVRIRRATLEELDPEVYRVQRPAQETISRLGEEKNVSALFVDIVGYTPFAERTPAYDVVYILNRYFHLMGQIVRFHGGRIIDYYGDGFFASFEQRDDSTVYALNAVQAGQQMFGSLARFNESLWDNYRHEFAIRAGIHSGPAIVGTIGTDSMTKQTVIGDPINMASRIEQVNKTLNTHFLICQTTYEAVRDQIPIQAHHSVRLRGKRGLFTVHQVGLAELV